MTAGDLAEFLLLERMDGDFLVGCSRSVEGDDVALGKARASEVAWWATDGAMEWLAAELDRPEMRQDVERAMREAAYGPPHPTVPAKQAAAAIAAICDRLTTPAAEAARRAGDGGGL